MSLFGPTNLDAPDLVTPFWLKNPSFIPIKPSGVNCVIQSLLVRAGHGEG